MSRVHFIAIGGAVMHNLAIVLKKKGYRVSGSDDEIFDPARRLLQQHGLLPPETGWFPEKITPGLEAVILGMHARPDNPELLRARELGIPLYSFPEYMFTQTQNKRRVVIGGSHGKTTVTSLVMHVLKVAGIRFDYLVGARLPGFDTMVGLDEKAELAVFEGDEYLSSALDPRPKFHWYRPHTALLTGISWDHMNVFPTREEYIGAFRHFIRLIEPGGTLIYFAGDPWLEEITKEAPEHITLIPYQDHPHTTENGHTFLIHNKQQVPVNLFGRHNMENMAGAYRVCRELGIGNNDFYRAVSTFTGAARRLEKLAENRHTAVYYDFAHAPSKVKATVQAMATRYPGRRLFACLELHTFSSLNPAFLPHYRGTLDMAHRAAVYYNPETVALKKLPSLLPAQIREAFGKPGLEVFTSVDSLWNRLQEETWAGRNLLMMSSGNFGGKDVQKLAGNITQDKQEAGHNMDLL
ncbi:MAG TPA: peptidoglycan synthetase [Bacteroidetes bacterium]|nr:peptidoglycan synthetase [Bacteroidota bacterium]